LIASGCIAVLANRSSAGSDNQIAQASSHQNFPGRSGR
jgi:hypothetical protein